MRIIDANGKTLAQWFIDRGWCVFGPIDCNVSMFLRGLLAGEGVNDRSRAFRLANNLPKSLEVKFVF